MNNFVKLPFYLLQSQDLPEYPEPLSGGAESIFNRSNEASQTVVNNFEPLWQSTIKGGLFEAMASLGVLIAVIATGFFLVQWVQQFLSGEGDRAFSELIWPIIVIVTLSNKGALLGTVTLELRAVGNKVNYTILNSAVANESLQQHHRQTQFGSAIDNLEAVAISECRETHGSTQRGRKRDMCIREARAKAEAERRKYGLPSNKRWQLPNIRHSIIQLVINRFLMAVHYAFQYVVELTLLIMSLFGPLAMGLSMIPGTSKAIFSWISNIAAVFLMKLTLNLVSGIAAYSFSQQQGFNDSLVLPVLLGVFSPILSVMVGLQGGTALFQALSTASVYGGYRTAARFIGQAGNAARQMASRRLP